MNSEKVKVVDPVQGLALIAFSGDYHAHSVPPPPTGRKDDINDMIQLLAFDHI